MTYEIKKEAREANAKGLTEIKKEMLNLLTESDDILMEVHGSKTMEYKMSKFWIKAIRDRLTGDSVISSLALDIESLDG